MQGSRQAEGRPEALVQPEVWVPSSDPQSSRASASGTPCTPPQEGTESSRSWAPLLPELWVRFFGGVRTWPGLGRQESESFQTYIWAPPQGRG